MTTWLNFSDNDHIQVGTLASPISFCFPRIFLDGSSPVFSKVMIKGPDPSALEFAGI